MGPAVPPSSENPHGKVTSCLSVNLRPKPSMLIHYLEQGETVDAAGPVPPPVYSISEEIGNESYGTH